MRLKLHWIVDLDQSCQTCNMNLWLETVRTIYIYWFTPSQLFITTLNKENGKWASIVWYNLKLQIIAWSILFGMWSPINQSTACNEKLVWHKNNHQTSRQHNVKLLTNFKIDIKGSINIFQVFDLSDGIIKIQ